jgi:hypothetical protein
MVGAMWRWFFVAALGFSLSCSETREGAADSATSAVASAAMDLEGHDADPFASPKATTVLVFISTDCPISNRYAPEIRRLSEQYSPRGVTFLLVYPGPIDAVDAIEKHLHDFAYPLRALRDPHHVLVARAGVTTTPEVAVVSASGEVVYHGRIDDREVDFGKTRPEATRHDLALALDALLAGRPIETKSAPPIGCPIGPAE